MCSHDSVLIITLCYVCSNLLYLHPSARHIWLQRVNTVIDTTVWGNQCIANSLKCAHAAIHTQDCRSTSLTDCRILNFTTDVHQLPTSLFLWHAESNKRTIFVPIVQSFASLHLCLWYSLLLLEILLYSTESVSLCDCIVSASLWSKLVLSLLKEWLNLQAASWSVGTWVTPASL